VVARWLVAPYRSGGYAYASAVGIGFLATATSSYAAWWSSRSADARPTHVRSADGAVTASRPSHHL